MIAALLERGVADLVAPDKLAPMVRTAFGANKFAATTSPDTGPVTTSPGELIVVVGGSEDTATPISTPTGNSLAYTLRSSGNAANNAWGGIWTATDAAGGTAWTLSAARNANVKKFGWAAFTFPAGSTVGHSPTGKAVNGAATINVVTTADNSSIIVAVFDWNVQNAAANWASINGFTPNMANQGEQARVFATGAYNIYVAYYPDVGAAGTKTITCGGLTFNNVMVAQEIIKAPTGGGGGPTEFEGWGVPI